MISKYKGKYKVGDQKVLVVSHISNGTCSDGTKLISDIDEDEEAIYVLCNENERFEVGELIAAECIFVHSGGYVSDWKRIGDE